MEKHNSNLYYDIELMKIVLSEICEEINFDSRHLWYLEMNLTLDEKESVDRILMGYNVNNEVPTLKK